MPPPPRRSAAVVSLVLDLSKHCIETAARHAQRRLLDQLIEADEPTAARGRSRQLELDAQLRLKLELVQEFLRSTDFSELRAKQPAMRGGGRARVELMRTQAGTVHWILI